MPRIRQLKKCWLWVSLSKITKCSGKLGGGSYLLFIEDIEGVESGNDNNDAVVRLLDLTGNVARGEEVEDVIVTEIFNKIKYF